jgi:hypothetical protein
VYVCILLDMMPNETYKVSKNLIGLDPNQKGPIKRCVERIFAGKLSLFLHIPVMQLNPR